MSQRRELNRRTLLQTGVTATALRWLSGGQLFGADKEQGKSDKPRDRSTFLFVDWFHVKKGELQVTLDPARITPDGKQLIETYARDFQKTFETGAHGFLPHDIPFGIRVTQEVAKRTQPWLVHDQPWERSVSSPTVLFDEGRYRCWYSVGLTKRRPSKKAR